MKWMIIDLTSINTQVHNGYHTYILPTRQHSCVCTSYTLVINNNPFRRCRGPTNYKYPSIYPTVVSKKSFKTGAIFREKAQGSVLYSIRLFVFQDEKTQALINGFQYQVVHPLFVFQRFMGLFCLKTGQKLQIPLSFIAWRIVGHDLNASRSNTDQNC